MPSVAVTRCGRCGATSQELVANRPIPVISVCACGGQRQVARILFRAREQAVSGRPRQASAERPRPALQE